MSSKGLYLFKNDLRLSDNPALDQASKDCDKLVLCYLHNVAELGEEAPGAASRAFLHARLSALADELREKGLHLNLMSTDDTATFLLDLCKEHEISAVYWSRSYEPNAIKRDTHAKAALSEAGVEVHSHSSYLLWEPWEIKNKSGAPYKVYTPFWKAARAMGPARPIARQSLPKETVKLEESLELSELSLLPSEAEGEWERSMLEHWNFEEAQVKRAFKKYLEERLGDYAEMRNRPDVSGVSRVSPYLHFGVLSARWAWEQASAVSGNDQSKEVYLKELVWREFSHHLLFHFPKTTRKEMNPKFSQFPWKNNKRALEKWQKGETGYPIVDAGMKELYATGWMHNRVRMIVASFLVKDLFLPWQRGAEWFWDTLVDANLASNTMGWQWTAGCGADAAPFFRVFNPSLQGEKFDPDGAYVKKWNPSLSKLRAKWVHKPWEAPPLELAEAGIVLGEDYPEAMVDHGEARDEALAAYNKLKS